MANLNPVPDSVEHLRVQLDAIARDARVHVYPYGAITLGEQGSELADLPGMAPDVAGFSDDGKGVQSDERMRAAMELFYAEGPDVVREIKARGHKIFLDLKLHDIPNTVKRAMNVLSRLDVDMVNLHAAGASEMMRAAVEGLTRPDGTRPLLIAVTQLTSTDAAALKNELLIDAPMPDRSCVC